MNQRGMSLVEVLVALAVFSAVSAVGVAAMSLAANGSRQLDEADRRISDMDRFRGILRADLYQRVTREVIEPDTDRPRPAFIGGDALNDIMSPQDGDPLLALVRSGWANPGAEEPRAELQAVTYYARNGAIVRRTRPFLDADNQTPFRDEELLTDLTDIEIAFRSAGRWSEEMGRSGEVEAPVALRISFEHAVYGPMEHLFYLEGGA